MREKRKRPRVAKMNSYAVVYVYVKNRARAKISRPKRYERKPGTYLAKKPKSNKIHSLWRKTPPKGRVS